MQKTPLNFIIFYIYILLVSFNSLSPPATTPAPASTAVQVSLGELLQPAPPLIVVPLPSLPSPFPLARATADARRPVRARDRGGLRTSSRGGRRRPPSLLAAAAMAVCITAGRICHASSSGQAPPRPPHPS